VEGNDLKIQAILPGVSRIERPTSPMDYAELRAAGIDTIISFESGIADLFFGAEQIAEEKNGMALVHLRWCPIFPPTRDAVMKARDLVKSISRRGGVGFHCYSSVDRTGVFALTLRILDGGWTWERALAEMRAAGFHWRFFWWVPIIRRWFP
jgi:protein tyrosine/serine phosphatase